MQSKSEKELIIEELHSKLEKAKVAIVAHPCKMDVATVTELRKEFRKHGADYRVVKNTLARHAIKGTAAENLSDLFKGQTALIVGYEDPVSPAKVLYDFIDKKKDKIEVAAGSLDGKLLSVDEIEKLSKLPTLDVLRATLLGMVNRPAQMLATVISQPANSIARVVKAKYAE